MFELATFDGFRINRMVYGIFWCIGFNIWPTSWRNRAWSSIAIHIHACMYLPAHPITKIQKGTAVVIL